jgi:hypothetical protein
MGSSNNFTAIVKASDTEAYNLGSVTQSPRAATSLDLEAACSNLEIVADAGTPDFVMDFGNYLCRKYFSDAHQTGLYNRQIKLWETISKITTLQVKALEKGFFSKQALPVYEIACLTQARQPVVMALYIDSAFAASHGHGHANAYLDLLHDFLAKVAKIQARLGAQGVKGIFILAPAPFPQDLLRFVEKSVGADDPVARFDSLLPAPYYVHINLLECGTQIASAPALDQGLNQDQEQDSYHDGGSGYAEAGHSIPDDTGRVFVKANQIRMVHPQLRPRQQPQGRQNSAQITYK